MALQEALWKPKGQVELRVGETSPHEFTVVEKLPVNCDIIRARLA